MVCKIVPKKISKRARNTKNGAQSISWELLNWLDADTLSEQVIRRVFWTLNVENMENNHYQKKRRKNEYTMTHKNLTWKYWNLFFNRFICSFRMSTWPRLTSSEIYMQKSETREHNRKILTKKMNLNKKKKKKNWISTPKLFWNESLISA